MEQAFERRIKKYERKGIPIPEDILHSLFSPDDRVVPII